jgi:YrbI family 3-deoxy-D-manno-octulosonate 8-phosphate phosphatase
VIPPDFKERALSLRLMVFDFDGVFTDNMVYVFEDGREAVCCSRSDGIGLRRLESAGVELMIVSTEVNPVVSFRAAKLKIACMQGVEDKLTALTRLTGERGIDLSMVGFVGNDINDRQCLARVGLPVVVADSHPEVLQLAYYRTVAVGGRGAVREICDLVAEARGASSPYGC